GSGPGQDDDGLGGLGPPHRLGHRLRPDGQQHVAGDPQTAGVLVQGDAADLGRSGHRTELQPDPVTAEDVDQAVQGDHDRLRRLVDRLEVLVVEEYQGAVVEPDRPAPRPCRQCVVDDDFGTCEVAEVLDDLSGGT